MERCGHGKPDFANANEPNPDTVPDRCCAWSFAEQDINVLCAWSRVGYPGILEVITRITEKNG